jgi:Leu/Phe-tRNA-protein transferase
MNSINPEFLINMYSKGYFPMAKSRESIEVNFYKPYRRFIVPILDFHIPKKIFKEFKKKNIFIK